LGVRNPASSRSVLLFLRQRTVATRETPDLTIRLVPHDRFTATTRPTLSETALTRLAAQPGPKFTDQWG
jgi:hypothetical protein